MGVLPDVLLDALRDRAGDPLRFIEMAELSVFRRFTRATPAQISQAEDRLGFPVPGGLRTLYLEVANGGFGPGYGLLGVDDGATDDLGDNVERAYASLSAADPEAPGFEWREHALPFCYLGCQVYTCVMLGGAVVTLDGYDWVGDSVPLVEWLWHWVEGSLDSPAPQ